ncbi:hypothetical protein J6590_105952, partial [Homalodisca vitripennis]
LQRLTLTVSVAENIRVHMCVLCRVAGITRLPVLEGEVSHIEIPRLSPTLGITVVGGSDTALVRYTTITYLLIVL